MDIRFSGYFSVLGHVLGNARRLLSGEEYTQLSERIRPEIIELAKDNQAYWAAKYSPVAGAVQDWIYERKQDRERSEKLFGSGGTADFVSGVGKISLMDISG